MTTTYDRMRAAADNLDTYSAQWLSWAEVQELIEQLRADADRLEAVEREMRKPFLIVSHAFKQRDSWEDRIRGEAT